MSNLVRMEDEYGNVFWVQAMGIEEIVQVARRIVAANETSVNARALVEWVDSLGRLPTDQEFQAWFDAIAAPPGTVQ